VNGKNSSLKANLKSGDEVIVFPLVAGGLVKDYQHLET